MVEVVSLEGVLYTVREALNDKVEKGALLEMYRKMVEIRTFEKRVEDLFLVEGALIGPCHLYLGEEAVAVGSISALDEKDPIVSTYRGHGHAIARGVPMKLIMAELFGKAVGTCKGIGGSMHAAMYPEKGVLYATAIVGSGIPIATGIGLAIKYKEEKKVAAVYFGDGAANTGAFHEGLNLASLWRLPVVFICENNLYAMSTRVDRALAGGSISRRAEAYGMTGILVDGNHVLSVYRAVKLAKERALRGDGPTLVECLTYRHRGHGVYDKAEYRDPKEVEEWLKRDPISRFRGELLQAKVTNEDELKSIDDEVKREVEEAVEFSQKSPYLEFGELWKFVYP